MRLSRRVGTLAAFVVAAAILLYSLVTVATSASNRFDAAKADRADLRRDLQSSQTALDDANARIAVLGNQVEDLGETPDVSVTPVGPRGPQGPGPTFSQVLAAAGDLLPGIVTDYCSGGRCEGADGKDGDPGPAGTNGTNGKDGADGAKGDKGDPGETCPNDTSLQETTVMTSPVDSTTVYVCR